MDLTNREIALLIWLAMLVAGLCSVRTLRGGLAVIIKLLFMGPIVRVLAFALAYITLCIFSLERVGIWQPANSKTTALWVLTFGLLTIFDFKRLMEDRLFFRRILRETLSVTVILVFLIDTYTFGLLAELVIVPFAALLAMLQAVPSKKPEDRLVQEVVGWLLALVGFGYLAHSAFEAFVHWNDLATVSTAREFGIPIILSLMFLPFLYWLRLYATYEQVFTGLNVTIPDKKLRAFARLRSMLAFRQNLDFLKRWRRMMNIDQPTTKEDVRASFQELRRIRRIEKDPPEIAPEEGWSPYAAKEFLSSEGFETDDYHRTFDNEWWCASRGVKVEKDVLAPTITYYVKGDDRAATELALEMRAFNCEDPAIADERFGRTAAVLLASATSPATAQEIALAMGEGEAADVRSGSLRIRLTKENHHAAKGTSYERSFVIEHDGI